ncbi:MAG: chorismate-binding protein, partial [Muribaculaceae bacterium]|nr:chorismate-binding protein [Muribaculaceae bacterium]
PDTADIYVNLRSGRVLPEGEGILLYAGGGITRDSIPEAEWMETERKLSTIMTHL